MGTRRGFLAGLLATGLAPVPSWADAGSPVALSAARDADGNFVLIGLGSSAEEIFRLPLPARGHAGAAHPTRAEAVAFARRPGTFALVLDCRTGDILATLQSPMGRHFYGHGTFSADGTLLYTTENDFEAGRGRIGIWDATRGYSRLGDLPSHGVGPHEICRMPDGSLVVANGGIDTHPATGREKLNLPTMRPNLSYLSLDGTLLDQVEPPHHHASVRHIAVGANGMVGIGMQWQGAAPTAPPLVATHRLGGTWQDHGDGTELDGYVGSVAFSEDGETLAATSPRAGQCQIFDAREQRKPQSLVAHDACGLASTHAGLWMTTGAGHVHVLGERASTLATHDVQFDNHLIPVEMT